MTNGTTVFDGRSTQLSTNSTGSFLTTGGPYRRKTWDGADRAAIADRPLLVTRTYTTVDRKGRLVRRKFRVRAPKRLVADVPHPYQMEAVVSRCSRFTLEQNYELYGPLDTTNYIIDAGTFSPPIPSWTANDELALILKLREKVHGSDFNLSVMLAEASESLQMIGDAAIKLAKAGVHFRRGNVFEAMRTLAKTAKQAEKFIEKVPKRYHPNATRRASQEELSQAHLELTYGWIPLVKDIQSGSEMLAHQLNVPFGKRYVARRNVVSTDHGLDWPAKGAVRAIYSKQIIAYLSERPTFLQMSGLTSPSVPLYELIPFSFVLDWIIPFGDMLQARAFASTLVGTFVTTTRTQQSVNGLGFSSFEMGTGHGQTYNATGSDYSYERLTLNRTVSTTLDVPKPVVKPISKAASWQHCTNAIALMGVLVKGREPKSVDTRFMRKNLGNRFPEAYWHL